MIAELGQTETLKRGLAAGYDRSFDGPIPTPEKPYG
jgi:hypothetical protein